MSRKRKSMYTARAMPAKDLCQTPGYALIPLLEVATIKPEHTVWEIASGLGYLSRALFKQTGCEVISTDIGDEYMNEYTQYHSFLNDDDPRNVEIGNFDFIITNPPFSLKYDFFDKCFEYGKPFALLVPSETEHTKTFIELVKRYNVEKELVSVVFAPRVNFYMPNKKWAGTAHFASYWIGHGEGLFGDNVGRFYYSYDWSKEFRKGFEV